MEPMSADAGFVHGTVTLNVAGQQITISAQPLLSPPWPTPTADQNTVTNAVASAPSPGDRIQNLLDLIQRFGPMILALLKLFGLKANPAEIAAALQAYHALNGNQG